MFPRGLELTVGCNSHRVFRPVSNLLVAAGLLCVFLYWLIQTGLALMPISKLRILFWVKGVVVHPTFLALFLWAVIVTKG
jgi:NCS1 family nucleobase:cation symporter-1